MLTIARRIASNIGLLLICFGGYPWQDLAYLLLLANAVYNAIWGHIQIGYAATGDPRLDPIVAKMIDRMDFIPVRAAFIANWVVLAVTAGVLSLIRFGPTLVGAVLSAITIAYMTNHLREHDREMAEIEEELAREAR